MNQKLATSNHDRDSAGMVYIYPVVSRRAGGVSIGVNLNPNNACNWHCAYCQVPDLKRGSAPAIDLELLEREFRQFLHELLFGDFMVERVPEGFQQICDVAISGNGEPTSSQQFGQVIDLLLKLMAECGLPAGLPLRLITNGSYLHKPAIRAAVEQLGQSGGELWFKFDAATPAAMAHINGVNADPERHLATLLAAATLCRTWVQCCVTGWDGLPPDEDESQQLLDVFSKLARLRPPLLAGVLLYRVARPPLQEASRHLTEVSDEWLHSFAKRIEALGLVVREW